MDKNVVIEGLKAQIRAAVYVEALLRPSFRNSRYLSLMGSCLGEK